MQNLDENTLEQALSATETDAAATLRAAGALMAPLRRFRAAAQVGDLQELRSSMEAAEQAMSRLGKQMSDTKSGWSFNAQNYLSSGLFAKEVMNTAEKMGVTMFERDDRLFCYPALLRVIPSERTVAIDRRRECHLRPSVLVNLLKELQDKPPRFRSESFLNALFEAYSRIVGERVSDSLDMAPVVPLVDIYQLLTLLPGQAREYSRQEFARDIYLLHRGNVSTTKSGDRVSFPISRGVRGKTLSVIDETGEERRYYGIRFTQEGI
ncbi:MAG: hypothetical protein O2909_09470 [Chloroflexi bacterium]|nr:hypothetical protein [Chloroflexota bacterium]MDA1219655.1 hypothetical protein [Chloroflexota bacterium]